MEPGSTQINCTKYLETLYPNSFDRIGDMSGEYDIKIDPQVPSVQHGRQQSTNQVQSRNRRRIEWDGPSRNHSETNGADTMGQLADVPEETKQ